MEKNNPNITHVARRLIQHFRSSEKTSTPTEMDELWKRIESQARIEKVKNTRRRILYIFTASSVAAIFLGVFLLGQHFVSYYTEDNTITEFAENQISQSADSEIILLMPGKKEIEVGANDANIVYYQCGTVVVNSDTVNQLEVKEKEMEFNQLIIPKGKRTQLTLSDGTRLWVNSGTRVVYPGYFDKHRREIYVEGEVYLDVFHDEKAPFIVKTKDFQVQVLGTVFNVSAYPSEGMSSVVLVEGSVNIKNQDKKQVKLAPGQLVNIHTGQLDTPKNVDVEPYVCWVKNMLMYTDEPLGRVFKKLDLYYGKEFILDPEVEQMLVSGKLDLKEKLEDVLHTISFSAPIYYENLDDKIYVRKE